MADRWRFIRTVLYQIGYDTYDSLDGIELVSISEDDYLYFTDNGVLYKADLDSTEKEPVNPPANELAVYTRSITYAIKTEFYNQVIEGVGGELPYTFSIDGTLPSGITLSTVDDNSALLSGTVTAEAGTYTFNVIIVDKNKDTTFKSFSLLVRTAKW